MPVGASSSSCTVPPPRTRRNSTFALRNAEPLNKPIASRNSADTLAPKMARPMLAAEPSCSTAPMMPAPLTTRIPASITTELCPMLKAKPTLTGALPWAANLRLELSIAAMWSQS